MIMNDHLRAFDNLSAVPFIRSALTEVIIHVDVWSVLINRRFETGDDASKAQDRKVLSPECKVEPFSWSFVFKGTYLL